MIDQLIRSKVTVTAVLAAAHGNDPDATAIMRNLAKKTKGRFYIVTNPKALPRIYQKEARSISRPLHLRASNSLAAQAELSDDRAGDGPHRSAARR